MIKKFIFGLFMILILFSSLLTFAVAPSDAPRMSKEELRMRFSDKDIVIIDVRTEHDWGKSNSRSEVRLGKIHRMSHHGPRNTLKRKRLFCTALDMTRELVPVWHSNL